MTTSNNTIIDYDDELDVDIDFGVNIGVNLDSNVNDDSDIELDINIESCGNIKLVDDYESYDQQIFKIRAIMPSGEVRQMQIQRDFNKICDQLNNPNKYKIFTSYEEEELKKILSWEQNLQCIQKWENGNQTSIQSQKKLYQCHQEWMQKLYHHKWIQVALFQSHLNGSDTWNSAASSFNNYCWLRYNILLLLLRTHFVLYGESYSNDQTESCKYMIQPLCDEVIKFCQDEQTQKVCLNAATLSYTAQKNPSIRSEILSVKKEVERFNHRTKMLELYHKYYKNEWWQIMLQEEWVSVLFLMHDSSRITPDASRIFELVTEIWIIKANEMYLTSEHCIRINEIWNRIQSLCSASFNQNRFMSNDFEHCFLTGDQVTIHEQFVINLKMEVIEEHHHELKTFETSLELLPDSDSTQQLKTILKYQLQKEMTELKLEQEEYCQQWKTWMMIHVNNICEIKAKSLLSAMRLI